MQKIYPNNRKIVVCGKMAELGEQSRELHQQVGENMIKNGVKKMFGFGGEEIEFYLEGWAKGGGNPESAKHFTDLEEITKSFKLQLKPEDVVLVKGSRSAQMERFVEKIK
jgi:UDP-N-acetylmuramoyl-tripeptide--D-alanyl-D-alanine ligase